MILLIFSLILVLIDYFIFEKRLRDFELILHKLDNRINFIDEVKKNEVDD